MKGVWGFALAVVALGAIGSPGSGQGLFTPEVRLQQAQNQLDYAHQKLQLAMKQLQQAEQKRSGGLAPQSEVDTAQLLVAQVQTEVAADEAALLNMKESKQQSDRLAALHEPVSVELRDAPVRQAAQTLTQASGMPISVDKGVPTDKRLTVVAQAVPLATVLETIARQAGLEIGPQGGGVLLRVTPSLEVNGQRTAITGPFEPWSEEWGGNPAGDLSTLNRLNAALRPAPAILVPPTGAGFSSAPTLRGSAGPVETVPGPALSGSGFGGFVSPTTGPPPGFGGPVIGGFSGYGTVSAGGLPVTMTALSSSTFVVASPAPGGEAGVTLTVYRLEGSQLRKVSSTVQRLGPGSAPMGALYGPPGGRVYRVGPGGPPAGTPGSAPENPSAAPRAGAAPGAAGRPR